MLGNVNDNNGKVLLALLAGASAGIIAGLLMAPEAGKGTRDSIKRKAQDWTDELDQVARKYMRKLEDLNITGTGSSLKMQGSWDEVKGRLRSQYGDLTDEDLTYTEGQADQLVGRLETKLGKTKAEIRRLISEI
ncbi:CsbD family protein [Adhaeribacter rhizoryzae]|uniref:CsbD family protein n=1 Tax=Adhaeribacter rhizoryzae TaxID=2607907 RepID=A0A5M6DK94_9BACT|nr:CsbD family protein [Adhaeribacter rhizoryzae]KAA5546649.1 CsbD family protein [Adhaeribacter rhizoryzae]